MTKFEEAFEMYIKGELQVPKVYMGDNEEIDYMLYQLRCHQFNLRMMALGFRVKGLILKDIKEYYGFSGKTARECHDEIVKLTEHIKQNYYNNDSKTNNQSGIQPQST